MVSTPKAPDPQTTANAQSGLNRDTALTQQQINMVDQVGPDGSLTYNPTGTSSFVASNGKTVSTPTYTATTTLSPQQQAIKDQTDQASLNLGTIANDQSSFLKDYLGKPVDLSRSGVDDFISKNYATDFNNQWDKDQTAQHTQLIASGLTPGSAAYNNAMFQFSNNRSKAYDNLLDDTYSSAVQTKLAERNQPLNEISALMSGSQVQNPTLVNTPTSNVAGVDYTGLVNQQYQSQLANSQAQMGGLFGLLGTGLTAGIKYSDRRLKANIRRVGTLDNGLPIYAYNMIGSRVTELGVMADEVETVKPQAVHVQSNGFKMVDYNVATEAA